MKFFEVETENEIFSFGSFMFGGAETWKLNFTYSHLGTNEN